MTEMGGSVDLERSAIIRSDVACICCLFIAVAETALGRIICELPRSCNSLLIFRLQKEAT